MTLSELTASLKRFSTDGSFAGRSFFFTWCQVTNGEREHIYTNSGVAGKMTDEEVLAMHFYYPNLFGDHGWLSDRLEQVKFT